MVESGTIVFSDAIWDASLVALGGTIAAATSFVLHRLSHRAAIAAQIDAESRQAERHEKAKRETRLAEAVASLSKLTELLNVIHSKKTQLDQMFEVNSASEATILDPALFIVPLLGRDNLEHLIEPVELSFLVEAKKTELIGRILLLQGRTLNHIAALEKYAELRLQYLGGLSGDADGSRYVSELDEKQAKVIERKVGELNTLIVGIVDGIDKDAIDVLTITEEFVSICTEHFGDGFPKFEYTGTAFKRTARSKSTQNDEK